MAKCACTENCSHHAGKACSNEGHTVPSFYLVESYSELMKEGKTVSYTHCLDCIVAEEERRKAAATAAKAASMKQLDKSDQS